MTIAVNIHRACPVRADSDAPVLFLRPPSAHRRQSSRDAGQISNRSADRHPTNIRRGRRIAARFVSANMYRRTRPDLTSTQPIRTTRSVFNAHDGLSAVNIHRALSLVPAEVAGVLRSGHRSLSAGCGATGLRHRMPGRSPMGEPPATRCCSVGAAIPVTTTTWAGRGSPGSAAIRCSGQPRRAQSSAFVRAIPAPMRRSNFSRRGSRQSTQCFY